MGELAFVGMGLGDERDLSRRALERLRHAGAVFVEEYTAVLAAGSLDRLAADLGRPILPIDRVALEAEAPVLEALDRHGSVVLLVTGDPFAATTHVALRVAAERRGHAWVYLPNASIHTAAASYLGLMHYRFGRTVSLPFPEPGFQPSSFVDVIAGNLTAGAHTLVLLDLRPGEGRFLAPNDAIRVLQERDADRRVLTAGRPLAVVARVGTDSAAAWWGDPDELALVDFGPPMHALVVPATPLHFQEEEATARFRSRRGP